MTDQAAPITAEVIRDGVTDAGGARPAATRRPPETVLRAHLGHLRGAVVAGATRPGVT